MSGISSNEFTWSMPTRPPLRTPVGRPLTCNIYQGEIMTDQNKDGGSVIGSATGEGAAETNNLSTPDAATPWTETPIAGTSGSADRDRSGLVSCSAALSRAGAFMPFAEWGPGPPDSSAGRPDSSTAPDGTAPDSTDPDSTHSPEATDASATACSSRK